MATATLAVMPVSWAALEMIPAAGELQMLEAVAWKALEVLRPWARDRLRQLREGLYSTPGSLGESETVVLKSLGRPR